MAHLTLTVLMAPYTPLVTVVILFTIDAKDSANAPASQSQGSLKLALLIYKKIEKKVYVTTTGAPILRHPGFMPHVSIMASSLSELRRLTRLWLNRVPEAKFAGDWLSTVGPGDDA